MFNYFRCLCSKSEEFHSDMYQQKEEWLKNLTQRLKDQSEDYQWAHYFLKQAIIFQVDNKSHDEYLKKVYQVSISYRKSKIKNNSLLYGFQEENNSENLSYKSNNIGVNYFIDRQKLTQDPVKQYSKLNQGSFLYQDILASIFYIKSQQSSKEIIQDNYKECIYFIQLMDIIKQDIQQSNNQIYPLIKYFFHFIYQLFEQNNYELIKEEIKSFAETLTLTVLDYYDLKQYFGILEFSDELTNVDSQINQQPSQNQFLRKENMDAYFFSFIVSEQKLQELIFQQIRMINQEESVLFNSVIERFQLENKEQYLMNLFQINPKYRLDKETLIFLKIDLDDQEFKKFKKPYSSAYNKLRKIENLSILAHKIKTIIKMQMKVMECINDFYSKLGIQFKDQIGGDDLLPIYFYIVIMANVKDLNIHLKFCMDYMTSHQQSSLSGYYMTNITAACLHLIYLQGKSICGQNVQKQENSQNINSE